MENLNSFNDVLQAVDRLSADEQNALVSIVSRRLAEQGRQRVIDEVRVSSEEFVAGKCRGTTVDDLLDEIQS